MAIASSRLCQVLTVNNWEFGMNPSERKEDTKYPRKDRSSHVQLIPLLPEIQWAVIDFAFVKGGKPNYPTEFRAREELIVRVTTWPFPISAIKQEAENRLVSL